MNDGPPAKRSDTQSPFAVLSPEVVRGQTGTRVKITESEAEAPEAPVATTSIPPESLKKPFSSLTPKKPTPSLPPSAPSSAAAPPPPPSQLFAETASMRPPTQSGTARTTTTATTRREPSSGAQARYGTCKEHGTALTSEGKCVLCVREKAKRDARNTSRLLIFMAIVLVGAAAYVVFRVLPN